MTILRSITDLVLDEPCGACHGAREADDPNGGKIPCPNCDGLGRRPTENGWALLMFLERFLADAVAEPCEACGETGRIPNPNSAYDLPGIVPSPTLACPDCDGRGQILTPAGRVLVHRLRPFLEE